MPATLLSPKTSVTWLFHAKRISGLFFARSALIFEARSSSRRCTMVTVSANFDRNEALLAGGVAAGHRDVVAAEEEAVAGGHAVAEEADLVREVEHERPGAGRDDDGAGEVGGVGRGGVAGRHLERAFAELDAVALVDELGAEAGRPAGRS